MRKPIFRSGGLPRYNLLPAQGFSVFLKSFNGFTLLFVQTTGAQPAAPARFQGRAENRAPGRAHELCRCFGVNMGFEPGWFNELVQLSARSVKILIAYWKKNKITPSSPQKSLKGPEYALPRYGEGSILCQGMSFYFQRLIKLLEVILKGIIK